MWNDSLALPLSEIRRIGPLQETWFEARPERAQRPRQHTLKAVDRALNGLRREAITMGRLAVDQVDSVSRALLDGDLQLSEESHARAVSLSELGRRIDQEIFRFIALYQPVATDLRSVRGLLLIAGELGNLGAEVETMARLTPQFFSARAQGTTMAVTCQLAHMAESAAALLRDSVEALHDSQGDLARKVIDRRDEIRSEFESALRVLLTLSFERESQRRATVEALFALNGLERIADCARHIGTEVLAMLDQPRQ